MIRMFLRICVALMSFAAAPVLAGDLAVDGEPYLFVPPVFSGSGVASAQGAGAIVPLGDTLPVGTIGTPFNEPGKPVQAVSTAATDAVVASLAEVTAFCDSIARSEYAVDCLSDGLATVARSLPATGEYAEARAILGDVSRKLGDLAAANADTVLPRGVARSGAVASARPLTAVRTTSVAGVNAQAAGIIDEAQTLLLRSSANSDRRALDYQRISAAVGSNKVLLRSA